MTDKRLLINRQWHTSEDWFSTVKFIREKFASVVFCKHTDTTSSAGDWSGLIIQKLGNQLYVLLFSQENTFPHCDGFDIYTDDHVTAIVQNASKVTDYRELFDDVCALMYTN
jgi:hypothetical protein